ATGTFNFSLAENVPDGHVATINVEITDGSSTWNETITITAVGPSCEPPTGLQVAVNNTDATITWNAQSIAPLTISDDFEGHTYGTINSPGTVGWTYIDGDNATTGSFSINFTGENSKMAYIVLDYSSVTNLFAGHSGNKFIADAFISSSVQNDDWIISPELNFSENFTFSFWARSGASRYPDEQFYAAYSTTGNSASDFINLNSNVVTTTTTWTQYSYNVPANAKYVAIHCVSSDQYMFCVDDITISGNVVSGAAAVNIYDNGVLVASNVTGGTYTATNLSVGEHCFSVRAVCNDDSESLAAQQCVTIENNLPSYTVTVNAGNGGSVTPNGTQTVYEGNNFTFTVTPNDCYEVASVTVDGNNVNLTNNQYTISNVTANHTVNVTFSQLTYTIAATVGNGGTITPAGNTTVNCGESQTYTIAANNGYRINEVTVDGQNMGAIETYTFSNVTANHTIAATFIAVLNIDINADAEGGSVTPNGTQTLDEGGSFTFTVTPDNCYEIGNITVNGTAVTLDANNSYTINNVTADQNINVTFNPITYTIEASASNGGTINPAGNTTVNCGGNQTYTIVPTEGYMISDVTVDGQSVGSASSYSFTNVTANHTISATFVEIPDNHIVVVVNADTEGGTVNPTGSQSIEQGSDFTFTVTPDACYAIGTVTVNGTAVTLDANNSYTIQNVTEAQEVNVTFTPITYTVTTNASNGGSIEVEGGDEVACGGNKTFTVTPEACYSIGTVIVNGTEVTLDANNSYTIENVGADQTIVATFNQISYTVAVNAGEGGTITPADGTVLCGENITFAISANEGYEIEDVVVDGQSRGVITSYTFENVTDNEHSIAATFTQIAVPECNAVEGLEVSVEPYGNLISWNASENAVSYNIFRNNETTALANVLSTSYVDVNGNAGDRYHIVTVCQYGESDASDEVEAIPTSIDENSISVELYPNPTDGKFMIECNEMATVEIFNMVGQIVERVEVSTNAITVDASAWTSGVYNVRITTSNASIIVKQVVKQ
ncbi:MAG: choice-of-anchor J domain-containing protein, partial [Bacteroidales bacterium]|nr:choice-of-anchor J domain-containing protein [Bacteroidales bacterium]